MKTKKWVVFTNDPVKSAEALNALTVVPLYRQLRKRIEDEINNGSWKPDDKIPSEAELSAKYGVSRITVRAALNELSEEGLLIKIQGKGTFVTRMKAKKLITISVASFTDVCRQNGVSASRRVVFKKLVDANENDIVDLGALEGEKIVYLSRVLYADDTPLMMVEDRLRGEFAYLLDMDLETQSLNALMLAGGKLGQVSSLSRTVEITSANAAESALLALPKGSPLLLIKDIAGDENGKPVRRSKELLAGDKVRMITVGK